MRLQRLQHAFSSSSLQMHPPLFFLPSQAILLHFGGPFLGVNRDFVRPFFLPYDAEKTSRGPADMGPTSLVQEHPKRSPLTSKEGGQGPRSGPRALQLLQTPRPSHAASPLIFLDPSRSTSPSSPYRRPHRPTYSPDAPRWLPWTADTAAAAAAASGGSQWPQLGDSTFPPLLPPPQPISKKIPPSASENSQSS